LPITPGQQVRRNRRDHAGTKPVDQPLPRCARQIPQLVRKPDYVARAVAGLVTELGLALSHREDFRPLDLCRSAKRAHW